MYTRNQVILKSCCCRWQKSTNKELFWKFCFRTFCNLFTPRHRRLYFHLFSHTFTAFPSRWSMMKINWICISTHKKRKQRREKNLNIILVLLKVNLHACITWDRKSKNNNLYVFVSVCCTSAPTHNVNEFINHS